MVISVCRQACLETIGELGRRIPRGRCHSTPGQLSTW